MLLLSTCELDRKSLYSLRALQCYCAGKNLNATCQFYSVGITYKRGEIERNWRGKNEQRKIYIYIYIYRERGGRERKRERENFIDKGKWERKRERRKEKNHYDMDIFLYLHIYTRSYQMLITGESYRSCVFICKAQATPRPKLPWLFHNSFNYCF